jgi:hypothetical protein
MMLGWEVCGVLKSSPILWQIVKFKIVPTRRPESSWMLQYIKRQSLLKNHIFQHYQKYLTMKIKVQSTDMSVTT